MIFQILLALNIFTFEIYLIVAYFYRKKKKKGVSPKDYFKNLKK